MHRRRAADRQFGSGLRPTDELSFYTVVEETHSDMPQPSLEVLLNEAAEIALGKVPQEQNEYVTENPRRDIDYCTEERRIQDEKKANVKILVAKELSTLVKELLDDILCPP